MHRVRFFIGGTPQRHDQNIESTLLQGGDFLGDKRFRQARVALEHERDASRPRLSHAQARCESLCCAASLVFSTQGAISRVT
ncbi:MAG: hypothetical protein ACREVG_18525, partial [Burkholderiales bacterium]